MAILGTNSERLPRSSYFELLGVKSSGSEPSCTHRGLVQVPRECPYQPRSILVCKDLYVSSGHRKPKPCRATGTLKGETAEFFRRKPCKAMGTVKSKTIHAIAGWIQNLVKS